MTARRARPRSTLKKTLKPSNTSIRLKSQVRVGSSSSPRSPNDGRPTVSTSAVAAPIRATEPGSSLARRPAGPVLIRSSRTTARMAAESTSSGRKYARLSVVDIALFAGLRRGAPRERPSGVQVGRRRGRRGTHLVIQAEERGALQVEDGVRIDAEEDDDRAQRRQGEELAEAHVGQAEILRVRLPEVHPLERPAE